MFSALWFNFLLFLAASRGLINLTYFFIMFVLSSLPINEALQRGQDLLPLPPVNMWPINQEAG